MRYETTHFRIALLILVTALVAAASALAIAAAPDPRRLALQKSDFPASAHGGLQRSPASGLQWFGVRGLKAADFSFTWPAGGSVNTPAGPFDKEWHLEGDVFVAPAEAGARKLFQMGKGTNGLFADVAGEPRHITSGLPRYGDEQLAYFWTHRLTGLHGVLFVRKEAVVWQLMVGPVPVQWRVTRTQVLRELKAYALKQKRRVGSG
jgi:hypothetical protein